MKKCIIAALTFLLCLGFSLSAGAEETASGQGGKQFFIGRLKSNTAPETGINEKSVGSASFEITEIGGSLPASQNLSMLKNSKLVLNYALSAPARRMAINYLMTYGGHDFQGNIYISETRAIFTKELLDLIAQFEPRAAVLRSGSVPEYLYLTDPQITYLWNNISGLKGQQIPREMIDIIAFALEAMPERCFTLSGDTVTLRLDQDSLIESIVQLAKKIQSEPDRFADCLARYIAATNPEESVESLRAEISAQIRQAGKTGALSTEADAMTRLLRDSELKLSEMVIVQPRGTNGKSSLHLALALYDKSIPAAGLTLTVESNRSGDNVSQSSDFLFNMDSEGSKASIKLSGVSFQSPSTASSNFDLKVTAVKDARNELSLGMRVSASAKVDKNLQVNVPVLTSSNSLNIDSLKGGGSQIRVQLDGAPVKFDVQPVIINGRTMVPVRNLAEALGCSVGFTEPDQVVVERDGKSISLYLGKNSYTVDDEEKYLDSPPFVKNGRVLVPLRFVAEEMGCQVNVTGDTIILTSGSDL